MTGSAKSLTGRFDPGEAIRVTLCPLHLAGKQQLDHNEFLEVIALAPEVATTAVWNGSEHNLAISAVDRGNG
ncbi:MAG: hypothetical protein WBJ68_16730 [Candidatus Dechloromonas phosphoritropha]|nr:hypothetical protein [Candidatus Dechloromonas phosphoritropha]MBP8787256.1 hypothetical protein [Azonexus sp.]